MKYFIPISILLLLHFSAVSQVPATLSLDGAGLANIKNKAMLKNTAALQVTGSIVKQADKLLSMKSVSVMEKEFTPVSGNKHDYMSQAPYFWYDSSKPKGLPYLRRDGERNPEINKITDRKYIGDLETATRMLSLAWYFTGDEKYAVKSATLLKHWFLDPEYKMNPNLEYGQAIPGINSGRGIGIIETRTLMGVADAASLLSGSAAWTSADMTALKKWFGEYLHWLLTSKNGKDEHAAKNNHGTWYFAQAITFALFSGDTKMARQLAEESKARLDSQLTADGRQPLELERTNALGYSTMNLRAWFEVANLAKKTGVDLYNFKTSRGSGIRPALEWLLPYATEAKAWTYQQISPYNKNEFYPILLLANAQYKDERYLAAARNIRSGASTIDELLFPIASVNTQPSTHIARITEDSIIIIRGTTYSFTVDTPEDKGLLNISTTTGQLLSQLTSLSNSFRQFGVQDDKGAIRNEDEVIQEGDKLFGLAAEGGKKKAWSVGIEPGAIGGRLWLSKQSLTVNTTSSLVLYYTVGQRSPNTTVKIYFPPGIQLTDENTTVNVIGRGEVKLKDLANQSIGRVGAAYPIHKVGNFAISKTADGGSVLLFKHLDFRPSNGEDLKIIINGVKIIQTGNYHFSATYTTSKPEVLTSGGIGSESAILTVPNTIADFERVADRSVRYMESPTTYTTTSFRWSAIDPASTIQLQQSADEGKTWSRTNASINSKTGIATVSGLQSNKYYQFRLLVNSGPHKGYSNTALFYSGKVDIKNFNVAADGNTDNTEGINDAISYLANIGGGTLLFSKGIYKVRTLHLKSNVWLYISKEAVIKAIKGSDAPESTWFSDRKYRSGLSPTDSGPYDDPENYLTKQDVGHHYFHNTMFFGERLDNIKIIGNGLITGDGNLVAGDRVMNNAADNRADKMFTLKLCSNLEIGGLYRSEDLWYDSIRDEPYYITKADAKDFDTGNMLQIDRAGHFVLLATGTDNIYVHNTYFARNNQSSVRDIYDFMACNNVTATNIYSKVSSDDIIKPGSDCSLGFTRPARNYKVRNIIGDTNCNLFQIGSETADDIMDVHVDNIYVLGANKAGFSISTNDGGHIKDIHLNCGHTGKLHSRSKMYRSYAPFFISISNRGRVLGASTGRFKFDENGVKHDELLVTNVDIGKVENVLINSIDIAEVYAGSSFGEKNSRWKAYDGSQKRATPIIAGYKLPDTEEVEGGLNFKLPNGNHTGYIQNIVFNDVHLLVKGGNSISDTAANPPELGVGQYNASNLKTEPSFGIWARHVHGLTVTGCTFNTEQPDHRYPIYLDDVAGARISNIKMICPGDNKVPVRLRKSSGVVINNASCSTEQLANTISRP